jgi:hypothetical protein
VLDSRSSSLVGFTHRKCNLPTFAVHRAPDASEKTPHQATWQPRLCGWNHAWLGNPVPYTAVPPCVAQCVGKGEAKRLLSQYNSNTITRYQLRGSQGSAAAAATAAGGEDRTEKKAQAGVLLHRLYYTLPGWEDAEGGRDAQGGFRVPRGNPRERAAGRTPTGTFMATRMRIRFFFRRRGSIGAHCPLEPSGRRVSTGTGRANAVAFSGASSALSGFANASKSKYVCRPQQAGGGRQGL